MKQTNSKYAFLFIFIVSGCLPACHPLSKEYEQIFEAPFPQELFLSYFHNINVGDSLLYVTNDTLDKKSFFLHVRSVRTNFEPYGEYSESQYENGEVSESAGIEYFNHEVTFSQNKKNTYLILSASCSQRKNLFFRCFDYHNNGYLDVTKDKPTNDIFSNLTDTLSLIAGDTTAILVRHKGLVWFKDKDGTKWYLN